MNSNFDKFSRQRVEELLAFSRGIIKGENGRKLIEKYKAAIDTLTPHDMLILEDEQLKLGISPSLIKKSIGKIINAFYKTLSGYEWHKPSEGEFLYYLMQENRELENRLSAIKKLLKEFKQGGEKVFYHLKSKLLPLFIELMEFDTHYIKKENILFPYLEKLWDNYLPLKVMWSLHDDIRKSLKCILSMLQDRWSLWDDLNREIGNYFFLTYGMIFKEDLIVFPVAYETVPEKYWEEMHVRSFEFPFPFINPPERPEIIIKHGNWQQNTFFQTETGNLNFEQMQILLSLLPVDLTVIDENDRVVYFTRSEERIFPRSSAIIGRKVQNCHPPESVNMVEKIISSFKDGSKDKAQFWITLKRRKLLIQYFAMRDDKGSYKGILEVSQDITEIQSLKGEKRLLDW